MEAIQEKLVDHDCPIWGLVARQSGDYRGRTLYP